jgi:hypothetical protein
MIKSAITRASSDNLKAITVSAVRLKCEKRENFAQLQASLLLI